jgi:hypothetical protein
MVHTLARTRLFASAMLLAYVPQKIFWSVHVHYSSSFLLFLRHVNVIWISQHKLVTTWVPSKYQARKLGFTLASTPSAKPSAHTVSQSNSKTWICTDERLDSALPRKREYIRYFDCVRKTCKRVTTQWDGMDRGSVRVRKHESEPARLGLP